MKKQIKPVPSHTGKLNLSKRTISNLNSTINLGAKEMNEKVGGHRTQGHKNTCQCTVTCFPNATCICCASFSF